MVQESRYAFFTAFYSLRILQRKKNANVMQTTQPKTFILDTNVVLHDSSCIHHFDEHDIVIPITVIEELDRFKKVVNL